jgi:hypothetical protein
MESRSVGTIAILGVHLPELPKTRAGFYIMVKWDVLGRRRDKRGHDVGEGEVSSGDNEGDFEGLPG